LIVHELAIPLIILYFVAGAPLKALWRKIARVPSAEEPAPVPVQGPN
jgi:hypothetical protein